MPRDVSSKAALKARIRKQLAHLVRLVPVDDWNDADPDLQLPSWPGWIDQILADLVLLQPLDPLAALRGLGALDGVVGSLDGDYQGVDDILEKQRDFMGLFPAFRAGLGSGDSCKLTSLVVTLVTEDGLIDEGDDIPRPLLDALGQDGRVTVALRLAELKRARSCPFVDLGWRMTEVLLAEPQLGDSLELIARLGLEEEVSATLVVRRFLDDRVACSGLLEWIRRVLREPAGDMEDTLSLVMGCAQLCDAVGQPEMAQAIRRDALPVVLDVDMQREWLERLPELQRELEEARALREVAGLEDKAAALLFLLAWPDLEAAERLVMEHHDTMVGQSCGTFNEAARRLEATAPRAAMLLYRRAAFCVFSTGPGLIDRKPRIDRCAALWARYPHGAYDSHAAFMERLEQEGRAGW